LIKYNEINEVFMTSAVGYFFPVCVDFEAKVRAALEGSSFPPHFVAARISYESSPFHKAPESDSYSCFTEVGTDSVLIQVGTTTAVADLVLTAFQDMLKESAASWEHDMQTRGHIDAIELKGKIEILSSAEPVSEPDYYAMLGVSPHMQIYMDQLNQLLETGDLSIGNILAFIPKLATLSQEEIDSISQSEDPLVPIRNFLGIPDPGDVPEDANAEFDKLRLSSRLVHSVFSLNLLFAQAT
jgi:hypothetical protein